MLHTKAIMYLIECGSSNTLMIDSELYTCTNLCES